MSDRPSEHSGLSSGDPLGSGAEERPRQSEPEHQPTPEPARPAPFPEEAPGSSSGGYTSPPPPGAGGVAVGTAPGAVAGQYTLAGWWPRVGAFLLDGLIIAIGALVVLAAFGAVFSVGFLGSEETGIAALVIGAILGVLAISIVALIYAPLMMARTNGKTLGRMATGIRVVRANGQPMTFGFAMLREVAVKALLFGTAGTITGGIANLLDYLWPLWDDENRALHDFVVDTRTVND